MFILKHPRKKIKNYRKTINLTFASQKEDEKMPYYMKKVDD